MVFKSQFNHSIILPPAIDALFGLTSDERFAEVKRVCERDEVEALNTFVAPLTNWMNDVDYVLDNYSDVVDALEDHFNKPGRPDATRATWGSLRFESEMLNYIDEKFGYMTDTPISWGGICHVFFNRSIRTMQRRQAYKAMLTSGDTVIPPKKGNGKPSGKASSTKNTVDEAEYNDVKNVASLAVKWASEAPDSSYAQAIMKLAAERAKRLGQNAPSFVLKSDARPVITTPKALFDFLNSEYINVLDDVFNPESEPKEFARKLAEFAREIARAFHGNKIVVEITVDEKTQ
ncbi:MAG: hypothetical protein JWN45_3073 [Acidobacteriaceae bacterium]|nr:hypothetical protein [Acidobacteriaceae bacterium]